jgi:nucleotidyltransferase substrate binding protein (TIGR01987 family)
MDEYLIFDEINIAPLLKAVSVFNDFSAHLNTNQEKAGAIQAFEFCFELSWKLLKRVLNKQGVEVASPRDTFRKAAENMLISDVELWFDFIKKRNLTVHTYNLDMVAEIVAIFPSFRQAIDRKSVV